MDIIMQRKNCLEKEIKSYNKYLEIYEEDIKSWLPNTFNLIFNEGIGYLIADEKNNEIDKIELLSDCIETEFLKRAKFCVEFYNRTYVAKLYAEKELNDILKNNKF